MRVVAGLLIDLQHILVRRPLGIARIARGHHLFDRALQRIEQRAGERAGGPGELGLEQLAAAAGQGLAETQGADLGDAVAEIGMADLMADNRDEIVSLAQ